MTDQLSLYNGALEILGAGKLASLTENREPRHKLDDIWSRNAVKRCLQQGQWNFATRSIMPAIAASVTPAFGYQNAFEKPTDFIRTTGVCSDEFFKFPLTEYTDETNYWFAELDVIYVRYVSSDTQYGFDFAIWPENFTEFVETWLAFKVAPRLTGISKDAKMLKQELKDARMAAKNTDSMEQASPSKPPGSWTRSRLGRTGGDRGSRSQLIG